MPRPPRPQDPHAVLHVTTRGNRGEPTFVERADFRRFLALVDETTGRFRWECMAYCLMTNHYHLIVRTPGANISQAMHHLNGTYARWSNRRHGLQGHLFERRFRSKIIESDWHLLEACRYVVLNPVRAGLVKRPSSWEWSSYGASVGTRPNVPRLALDELLGLFGKSRPQAWEAFRAFVDDAPARRPF